VSVCAGQKLKLDSDWSKKTALREMKDEEIEIWSGCAAPVAWPRSLFRE
jgi:hypothetical protein